MKRVREIVHAKKVYENGYTGKGIRIALLDTGIAMHPDLENKSIIFRDFIDDKRIPYDDNGHGTHIAGILCANGRPSYHLQDSFCRGMAPEADLAVLKILDGRGNGSTRIALEALDWIKNNYRKYNIRLLNFSIGYLPGVNVADQRKLLTAVDELWDLGIAVVTAAGNNGPMKHSVTVPGISRKVITVGACDDEKMTTGVLRRGYSGKGPTDCCIVKPEILAPGTNILSLNHTGGYIRKSGTSMAAPVVCGAMALAFEKDPKLTPALLKLQLYESVVHENNLSQRRCWGILHVDHLLASL